MRAMQTPEDMAAVAWNRVVPHILATGTAGGRTLVWDLRAGKTVLTLATPANAPGVSPIHAIAWQPDVATSLATAAASDLSPVVQVRGFFFFFYTQVTLLGELTFIPISIDLGSSQRARSST